MCWTLNGHNGHFSYKASIWNAISFQLKSSSTKGSISNTNLNLDKFL